MKKIEKKTTAKNLEKKFDVGETILDYFDASQAVRGDIPVQAQRVNVEQVINQPQDDHAAESANDAPASAAQHRSSDHAGCNRVKLEAGAHTRLRNTQA